MKREIKFRAKRANNGEWVYGDLLQTNEGSVCIGVRGQYIDDGMHFNDMYNETPYIDEDTVGQFTGLTDCNGTEIYEGDILKLRDKGDTKKNICVVKWNETIGAFCIRFSFEKKHGIRPLGLWIQESVWIEVIGNIHDNPDMLK